MGGCTVHNYPEPQSQQRQAQAGQSAKPTPGPATRSVPPAPAPTQSPQQKPAPQPAAAAGRSYTIKPGDNLWNISREVYGDGTKYQRILDANPGLNPDNMKPGTKIVIP
ncbi:MAG: LysM peptidoglycan-binding domain-containing protein [Planctomycetota bacterium]|nr:LysM peptidoglycan-binding domain-containing protein [Planctomycetota bacterium]